MSRPGNAGDGVPNHVYEDLIRGDQLMPRSVLASADWGPFKARLRQFEHQDSASCRGGMTDHFLHYVVTDLAYSQTLRDGRRVEESLCQGELRLVPAQEPFEWSWDNTAQSPRGIHQSFHVYIDPDSLGRFAGELGGVEASQVHLQHGFAFRDKDIEQKVRLLLRETQGKGLGSRLYVDTVAQSLSVDLLRELGTCDAAKLDRGMPFRGRLDAKRLAAALERLHDAANEDLTLDSLAASAWMSSYHFCRVFKRTTGYSPHQYQLRLRVENAKRMLAEPAKTRLSLCQIGLACGFSDQPHFTRCFKRVTGVTPGSYLKTVP